LLTQPEGYQENKRLHAKESSNKPSKGDSKTQALRSHTQSSRVNSKAKSSADKDSTIFSRNPMRAPLEDEIDQEVNIMDIDEEAEH
jgi:hypothetical protein